MKSFLPVILTVLTVLPAGCSQEPRPLAVRTQRIVLEAGLEESRTYIVGGQAAWSGGDQLRVFDSKDQGYVFGSATSGSLSTSFEGKVTEGAIPLYAVYPGHVSSTFQDGQVTMAMNPAMTAANNNSWPNKTNISIGHIDVLGPDTYGAEMRNVLGFLSFTVPEDYKATAENGIVYAASHVKKVTVRVGSGSLAGTITFAYNDGEPAICKVENGTDVVSLALKSYYIKDSVPKRPFYLTGFYLVPVIPGDYEGVTMTVSYDDGRADMVRTSSNTLRVRRSTVTDLGILTGSDCQLVFNVNVSPFFREVDGEKVPLPSSENTTTGGKLWVCKTQSPESVLEWGFFSWEEGYFRHDPEKAVFILGGPKALVRVPSSSGYELQSMTLSHGDPDHPEPVRVRICADPGDPVAGTAPAVLRYIDVPKAPASVVFYLPENRVKRGEDVWLSPEKEPLMLSKIYLKFVPSEEEGD